MSINKIKKQAGEKKESLDNRHAVSMQMRLGQGFVGDELKSSKNEGNRPRLHDTQLGERGRIRQRRERQQQGRIDCWRMERSHDERKRRGKKREKRKRERKKTKVTIQDAVLVQLQGLAVHG